MNSLKSILQKIHARRPGQIRTRPPIASPGRDWGVILYVTIGIFGLLVVLAAWLYLDETAGIGRIPIAAIKNDSLTSDKIDALVARYQLLGIEHAALYTTTMLIADPSEAQ